MANLPHDDGIKGGSGEAIPSGSQVPECADIPDDLRILHQAVDDPGEIPLRRSQVTIPEHLGVPHRNCI